MRHRLLLLILVMVAVAPRAARAERAALFVQVPAGMDRAPIAKSAKAAIEAGGWTASDPVVRDQPLGDLVDCVAADLAESCVPGFLDNSDPDADRMVLVRIAAEANPGTKIGNVTILVWVLRRSGGALAVQGRECNGCQAGSVATIVGELVDALVQQARSEARPSFLQITSTPAGAVVSLDGQKIGVTPMKYRVTPGHHQLAFELEGHRRTTKDAVVGDGDTMAIDVRLPTTDGRVDDVVPVPPPDDVRPEEVDPPRPSRLAPWLVIGGGAALVVTGGALILLDENPGERPHSRKYRDTALTGYGVAAAGAVAVTVGIVWLTRINHSSSAGSSALAPSIQLRGDGAIVGAIGRF